MWDKIKEAVMGRSVKDLADEVDRADQVLVLEQQRLADLRGKVAIQEQRVQAAQEEYDEKAEALVTEHPGLLGRSKKKERPVIVNSNDDVIEIDDENDPRWTAGIVPSIPTDDAAPMPSIDFSERGGE